MCKAFGTFFLWAPYSFSPPIGQGALVSGVFGSHTQVTGSGLPVAVYSNVVVASSAAR